MALPPMPRLPITSEETLARCAGLPVDPSDVFICSFPKSGTTWTQAIVYALVRRDAEHRGVASAPLEHISAFAPFFEVDATWAAGEPRHAHCGVRAFNTHLRWDMMPRSRRGRYLYVYRSGEDVCASFFHHLAHQAPEDGGFAGGPDDFLGAFLAGRIAFGKWVHHLKSWMPLRDASDGYAVLFLRYEDLLEDLATQVARVARFLGLAHVDLDDAEDAAAVLGAVTFAGMRARRDFYQPRSVRWIDGFQFLRRGEAQDSRRLFSEEQLGAFRAQVQEDFGHEVPRWFREEGLLVSDACDEDSQGAGSGEPVSPSDATGVLAALRDEA